MKISDIRPCFIKLRPSVLLYRQFPFILSNQALLPQYFVLQFVLLMLCKLHKIFKHALLIDLLYIYLIESKSPPAHENLSTIGSIQA